MALRIRTKLFFIVTLALALALVPLLVSTYIYYFHQYRTTFVEQVQTETERLSEYLQAPLALELEEDAMNLLRQVSMPDDYALLICNQQGGLWLKHGTTGAAKFKLSCNLDGPKGWLTDRYVHTNSVKDFSGTAIGMLFVEVSTGRFWQAFFNFNLATMAFLLVSLSISFLAVKYLFRSVFKPLEALHERSLKVIESRDYATEIPIRSNDEFGQLSKTFNAMLAAVRNHIAERNHAIHEMNMLANYDSLTGLPNRALCMDRLQIAINEADNAQHTSGIMFLDLDHFKDINDSLGHRLGDLLLVTVSHKLNDCLPKQATLARLGGDEFFVIIPEVTNNEELEGIAKNCCEALSNAIQLEGNQIHTRVSIGIALYPDHGNNPEEIMRAADAAMYHAKESGRNTFRFFENNLSLAIKRRHYLANELHTALERSQLFMVYQPIVDLEVESGLGFEALMRWQHPELGLVSPSEFIPIAETSGIILDIGDFVLRRVMEDVITIKGLVAEHSDFNAETVRISINLSAAQFRNENMAQEIRETANQIGVSMRNLTFEVTESLFISEKASASRILETLREEGCSVSIDDFGTGYSSLAYLSTLPIDTLKIDRGFVDEIDTNFNDRTITLAIIRLAKSLGKDVVAEGVETESQLSFLQRENCAKVQGYYFGRPIPVTEIHGWLQSQIVRKKSIKTSTGG